MAKKGLDNKSPPIGLEINGRIPEAISRLFEGLMGLFCDIIQYFRLRMSIANKRLNESMKKRKDNHPPN